MGRGSGRTLPDHVAFLSFDKPLQKWEVSPMPEREKEGILQLQRTGDVRSESSEFSSEELALLAGQRRADMFVTVSTYKAKAGEEDAIIALHEDWQRHQQPHARSYLSGELLRNVEASRE